MDFLFILFSVCFSENSTSRNDDGCRYIEPPSYDKAYLILTDYWSYLAMCDFGFAFPDGSTTKEFKCIVDVDDKGKKNISLGADGQPL